MSIADSEVGRKFTTLRGIEVDVDSLVWRIKVRQDAGKIIRFNWGLLNEPKLEDGTKRKTIYSSTSISLMKRYIEHGLKKHEVHTISHVFTTFREFEKWLFLNPKWLIKPEFDWESLTYETFLAYVRTTEGGVSRGAKPSIIRNFYKWAVQNEESGFDKSIWRQLKEIKLKGALTGHIARGEDVVKGAFSWEEQALILDALQKEVGTVEQRTLIALFQQTGIRPLAAVLLQQQDLIKIVTSVGTEYRLSIPRIKQIAKTNKRLTTRWVIDEKLGKLLESFKEVEASPDSPLFSFLDKDTDSPEERISYLMKSWAKEAKLLSPRVYKKDKQGVERFARLHIFPYRFRRTMASNLAEQGCSATYIAEMLDDSTLAMAQVYAQNTSNVVDKLKNSLDSGEFGKIIKLFTGEIMKEEHKNLPEILGGATHLADFNDFVDIGGIGKCGSTTLCQLRPPLSCYRCQKFKADPNGPHRQQLVQIERDIKAMEGKEPDRMVGLFKEIQAAILQVITLIENDNSPERDNTQN